MSQATYDDVNLILRLYDIRREEKMRGARAWFAQNFKPKSMAEFNKLCPPGSDPHAWFRQVISYWDMTASFITAEVLSRELFFQNNREMLLVWVRVQPIVEEMRAAFKDPSYLKNLETVGHSYAEYLKKQGEGTYEAFTARVGG